MNEAVDVRDALREWANGASATEREELRVLLVGLVEELKPSIADRIRFMSAAHQPLPNAPQGSSEESKSPTRRKTPKNEQRNQIDWIVARLRDRGSMTVKDLVSEMIACHTALQARPAPDRTAMGRLRTAIDDGLVAIHGGPRRAGNGVLQISVRDVVVLPKDQGGSTIVPFGHQTSQLDGHEVTQSTSASSSSAESERDSGEYSRLLNGLPSATSTEQVAGRNGVSAER